jgi:hypothetical protein
LDEVEDAADEEAGRFRDLERLHRAIEISIVSLMARKTSQHVHGMDDRITGMFWATGNDADSKMETEEDEPSMRQSEVSVVNFNTNRGWCKVQEESKGLKKARSAKLRMRVPKVRPWEGPLPAPRISPKLLIGDIIEKAQDQFEIDCPCLELAKSVAGVQDFQVR